LLWRIKPVRFAQQPKERDARRQIRAAMKANVAPGTVLMDASYGTNSGLRRANTGLGRSYVAAIISTVKVRLVRRLTASAITSVMCLKAAVFRYILRAAVASAPICWLAAMVSDPTSAPTSRPDVQPAKMLLDDLG
jgi:hypothetical protein